MVIQELITTLDAFRDEYNASTDKDVKKLCGFIQNTIDGLQAYIRYFSNEKSRMETNKQYFTEALDTINKLLTDDTEPTPEPTPDPGTES